MRTWKKSVFFFTIIILYLSNTVIIVVLRITTLQSVSDKCNKYFVPMYLRFFFFFIKITVEPSSSAHYGLSSYNNNTKRTMKYFAILFAKEKKKHLIARAQMLFNEKFEITFATKLFLSTLRQTRLILSQPASLVNGPRHLSRPHNWIPCRYSLLKSLLA